MPGSPSPAAPRTPLTVILMGVSGSGKTSVGKRLGRRLGWKFYEGDDYHPPENIRKMGGGIPLADEDREPWLRRLRDLILEARQENRSIVLACSALKRTYREILSSGIDNVVFIYLKGTYPLLYRRLEGRRGHYMGPRMLRSQFRDLEEPEEGVTVETEQDIDAIVKQIEEYLTGAYGILQR